MRISIVALLGWASVITSVFTTNAIAQTQAQKDDAKWLVERITGVKWTAEDPIIQQANTMAAAGNRSGIAALATSQPQFLNVTVKNFGLKMSTREESIRLPLNDFTATIMGVTRDESDARELLYGNFFYVGDANLVGNTVNFSRDVLKSNNHFANLDNRRNDIGAMLVRVNNQRLIVTDQDNNTFTLATNPDPGGVLTSRTWIEAHAVAGTNRRPVEYTFREFLCIPIEKWADAAASDVRIGRDIDRFPGGDHLKFQTTCKACHTGMDGFRGAWAKWNFESDTMVQSTIRRGNSNNQGIMNKMNQNNTVYPGGYVVTDDSWVNNAVRGVNVTTFGFRGLDGRSPASAGVGVNQFGRLIANSQRFSTCMAKRVFETVCRKELPDDQLAVAQSWGSQFEASTYNLKQLFRNVALSSQCK